MWVGDSVCECECGGVCVCWGRVVMCIGRTGRRTRRRIGGWAGNRTLFYSRNVGGVGGGEGGGGVGGMQGGVIGIG